MATYWLPSSTGYYDTNKTAVKYRIRIVEGTFNSSARTLPITVQAYFYRTNTGYTTDYTHTLKYTVNGTAKSYSNAYGTYPITNSGVYLNAYTVNVPVNDNGTVSATVYCQYTSTNSSNLTTSNNGGTVTLTKQTAKTYTNTIKHWRYVGTGGNNSNGTMYNAGDDSTFTATAGATVTIPSNLIKSYTGYSNNGNAGSYWGTSTWSSKSIGSTFVQPAANIGIEYYYYPITYAVTYNANGGSGAPATQTKTYGVTLTLSSTVPTRDGYNFLGWGTSATATSATYSAGGSYTANAAITLYAVWTQSSTVQTIMARFQNTDGTWGTYEIVYSASIDTGNTCSWSQPETDEFKPASISYTVTGVATKYIDIYRKQYTVSFKSNGGLWTPPPITYYYGSNLYLKKRPTRSGYKFLGWAFTSVATEINYTTDILFDTTNTSNPTLYAIWSKCSQDIYLYDDGTSCVGEYIEN